MKKKYIYALLTFAVLQGNNLTAQVTDFDLIQPEKVNPFQSQDKIMGFNTSEAVTCFLNSSYSLTDFVGAKGLKLRTNFSSQVPSKEFVVNVEEDGEYYFLANVMPANIAVNDENEINLQKINVLVNGVSVGLLNVTTAGWEVASINGAEKVYLTKGLNNIIFQSLDEMYYPEVDCVQASKDKSKLQYRNEPYENYMSDLRGDAIKTRNYNSHTVTPKVLDTPGAQYKHISQVPVVYTYYRKLNLQKGTYVFYTGPVAGDDYWSVDPIMYLFSASDPNSESWYNEQYANYGFHPRIDATVKGGEYYLVVRARSSHAASYPMGRAGLVNVYDKGGLINSSVPVSGYHMDDASSTKTGSLNYFTAHCGGNAKIWFIDGTKMKFYSEEYSYYAPADYMWIDGNARLKINFNKAVSNIRLLVSAAGAWSVYWGSCDLYAGVPDVTSDYLTQFKNYKSGDAMLSAPSSTAYNSAAWAGGITNQKIWTASKWGDPFVWTTWDSYFANKPQRYANAPNYTRSGPGKPVVAVYSTNNNINAVKHFAVSNRANTHMHGYMWESKIDNKGRIFHPVNSLSPDRGNVFAYYYDGSMPYSLSAGFETLDESINAGLTIIEDVKLSEEEQALLVKQSNKRVNVLTQGFYTDWKNALSQSVADTDDPYRFIDCKEGKLLAESAKTNPDDNILYVANKLFNEPEEDEDGSLSLLFCEIAREKYGDIIEDIKANWEQNCYTESGEYIFPSPKTITRKYAKEILNRMLVGKNEVVSVLSKEVNNDSFFSISGNPVVSNGTAQVKIDIPQRAKVSITIHNGGSNIAEVILLNQPLDAGVHTYTINTAKLKTGLNVCVLDLDGVKYSRKILKVN